MRKVVRNLRNWYCLWSSNHHHQPQQQQQDEPNDTGVYTELQTTGNYPPVYTQLQNVGTNTHTDQLYENTW